MIKCYDSAATRLQCKDCDGICVLAAEEVYKTVKPGMRLREHRASIVDYDPKGSGKFLNFTPEGWLEVEVEFGFRRKTWLLTPCVVVVVEEKE